MWQKISHIFCHDKKVKHVVSFIISKKVYSHTGHKLRSSNLIKHKCKIDQTTITSFMSVKVEVKKNLSFFKFEVTCKFVSKDVTPFVIAAGDGFIEMAWFLIHVRAKHGTVSAKSCYFIQQICHGSKVKLQLLSDTVFRRKLKTFSGTGGTMILDLWSDVYTRINYLTVPVHYIANGKLKNHDRITKRWTKNWR